MQALWMLVASLCFGTMGLFIKLAGQAGASLSDVILFRGFVPALVLTGWAVASGRSLRSPVAGLHFKRNLFGISAMWLSFYATTVLPLATAVTLMYTSPLFIALIMHFWFKHRSNRVEASAILLGFAGVVFVLQPVFNSNQLWVALSGLSGGALAALAYLQLKSLGKYKEPEWRTVLYFAGTATLTGLAMVVITHPDLGTWVNSITLSELLYLTGIGLFGGAGNLALTRSFGSGSTWLSASLQYTTILVSTAYGIWVFGNVPAPTTWLGVFLIMACGALSSWSTHRQTRKQSLSGDGVAE